MTNRIAAQDRRWIALALLCVAQFVVVLDASIVNVALPTIGDALKFTESDLPWVVNAYVLTFGGFLLLGGRAADLLGRRAVFMSGLVLSALASLAGGLAVDSGQLIAARAVQGLGAAIISPAALSIVTTTFAEGAERNRALGVWGAVAGAGGAAGVLLGGILTDGLGWEWVLFVNVPIGLAAAVITPMLVAESRSPERQGFDVLGAVTVTAGLALLIYTVVGTIDHGWGSAWTVAGFGVAAAVIVAFLIGESTARAPLIRLGILRSRTLSSANVVGLMTGGSLFSMFFFISLYLQRVLGYSPLKTGFAYPPLAVAIFLFAGAPRAPVGPPGVGAAPGGGRALVLPGLGGFPRGRGGRRFRRGARACRGARWPAAGGGAGGSGHLAWGRGEPHRPLRPLPHRPAAPGQPAHRAAGLAVRALGARTVPRARRGPRPRPVARALRAGAPPGPGGARARLGRRGRAPVRARRAVRRGHRAPRRRRAAVRVLLHARRDPRGGQRPARPPAR